MKHIKLNHEPTYLLLNRLKGKIQADRPADRITDEKVIHMALEQLEQVMERDKRKHRRNRQ